MPTDGNTLDKKIAGKLAVDNLDSNGVKVISVTSCQSDLTANNGRRFSIVDKSDIFYTGSIKQVSNHPNSRRVSVISLDKNEEKPDEFYTSSSDNVFSSKISFREVMSYMANWKFSCFMASTTIACITWPVPFSCIPLFMKNAGHDQHFASIALLICSVCNGIGRITTGLIVSSFPLMSRNCLILPACGYVITAFSFIGLGFSKTVEHYYCLMGLFGYSVSIMISLISCCIVAVVPMKLFSQAYGIMETICFGIFIIVSNPLAMTIYEAFDSQAYVFLLCSSLILLAAVLQIISHFMPKVKDIKCTTTKF